MKITKSELQKIIAEELEESVIEEGLFADFMDMFRGGAHGDARQAMVYVKYILDRTQVDDPESNLIARLENDSNYKRHLETMKRVHDRRPGDEKVKAALPALIELPEAQAGILKARKQASAAQAQAAAKKARDEWTARITQDRERILAQKLARAATSRTKDKPRPRTRGYQTDLQRSQSRGTMYGGGGMGESINKDDLYGIVLEELQAVLKERNK